MSNYTVFAGVNGAGKSTLYSTYKDLHDEKRVNCDEIVTELGGDWRNNEDQFRAGKVAIKRIENYLSNGISFNQETTLASKVTIRYAERAKELGYTTELHFVYVESADVSIDRVNIRVRNGGHGIPEDVIRRRYLKSIANLKEAIKMFDIVYVYDNTYQFKVLASYYHGEMAQRIDYIPKWFEDFINNQ